MDFDDEASKLLEKALSSFDGIILGKAQQQNSRTIFNVTKSMRVQLARRQLIHHESGCKQIFIVSCRRQRCTPAAAIVECFVGSTNTGPRLAAM